MRVAWAPWMWHSVLSLPTRPLESQQEIKINEKPALQNACRILAYSLPAHETVLAIVSNRWSGVRRTVSRDCLTLWDLSKVPTGHLRHLRESQSALKRKVASTQR